VPVLGTPIQERHRHIGTSPAKDQEDDQGSGASNLQGEAERSGTVHPGEEEAQGGLISVQN